MSNKLNQSFQKAESANFSAMIVKFDDNLNSIGFREMDGDEPIYAEALSSMSDKYSNYFVLNKEALVDVLFLNETGIEIERNHYVDPILAEGMSAEDVDNMFALKPVLKLQDLSKEITLRFNKEINKRNLKLENVDL